MFSTPTYSLGRLRYAVIVALAGAAVAGSTAAVHAQPPPPPPTTPTVYLSLVNNTSRRLILRVAKIEKGGPFVVSPPQIIDRGARAVWHQGSSHNGFFSTGHVNYSVENAGPAYADIQWNVSHGGTFDGRAGGLFTMQRTGVTHNSADFRLNCIAPTC
ncbi:hypothetical protein [Nocardia sp. NPDC051832]|uniref:hypothetical protein n=1 Tax=Nocardia sp. NPDC051832 TaxID=3155673 RepID=UPI003439197A